MKWTVKEIDAFDCPWEWESEEGHYLIRFPGTNTFKGYGPPGVFEGRAHFGLRYIDGRDFDSLAEAKEALLSRASRPTPG